MLKVILSSLPKRQQVYHVWYKWPKNVSFYKKIIVLFKETAWKFHLYTKRFILKNGALFKGVVSFCYGSLKTDIAGWYALINKETPNIKWVCINVLARGRIVWCIFRFAEVVLNTFLVSRWHPWLSKRRASVKPSPQNRLNSGVHAAKFRLHAKIRV